MKPTQMYVRLDGLRFYARHGVLPQETKVGAEFTVDLRLAADFSCAAEMDELEGTLNYAEVFERVKAEMEISSKCKSVSISRIRRWAPMPEESGLRRCIGGNLLFCNADF